MSVRTSTNMTAIPMQDLPRDKNRMYLAVFATVDTEVIISGECVTAIICALALAANRDTTLSSEGMIVRCQLGCRCDSTSSIRNTT